MLNFPQVSPDSCSYGSWSSLTSWHCRTGRKSLCATLLSGYLSDTCSGSLAIRVMSFLRETRSFAGGSQALLTHYPLCSIMLRNMTNCSLSILSCGCMGMDWCLFIPGGWAVCAYSSRTPKSWVNPCMQVVPQPWLKHVPSQT